MKLAKKILVAMLALALLASAFMFSATAENTFTAPTITEVDDIIEYYALQNFVSDSFDNGTYDDEVFTIGKYSGYDNLTKAEVVADPANADNGVLSLTIPYAKDASYEYKLPSSQRAEGFADEFYLNFKFYFDESAMDDILLEFKAGVVPEPETNLKPSAVARTVFTINVSKGKDAVGVYTASWDQPGAKFESSNLIEGSGNLVAGKWYDAVCEIDGVNDIYCLTIKDADGNLVATTGEIATPGLKGLHSYNFYGKYSNNEVYSKAADANAANECATFYLDDLNIYEGSFVRLTTDKRDAVTEAYLKDIDAIYNAEGTDLATKQQIAEVLDYLYGLDAKTFTVGATLPNAEKYINETYAAYYAEAVKAINTSASYADRVAYLKKLAVYDSALPANEELAKAVGITDALAEGVKAARVSYAAEIEAVEVVKAQSEAFITYMATYDTTKTDYAYITGFYNEAAGEKYNLHDPVYEGIEETEAAYQALKATATRIIADVDSFINSVATMETATTFGSVYAAYTVAYEGYTKYGEDGLINPDFDLSTHTELLTKIASYESLVDEIVAQAFICDEFNRVINEATISSYYTSLVEELNEAAVIYAELDDYVMDYPGITDSITIFEALNEQVSATGDAVTEYVNAVNAIATKTTFADKKAAIEAALVLKELGDVLGAEGVKEANIALTAAEAEINVLEGNSKTLISLVSQIKAADTLAKKRELIRLANVSAAGAEATYTGVTQAKADLATAIAEFEAAVAEANGALASATKNAQAIVNAVDGSDIFVAAE